MQCHADAKDSCVVVLVHSKLLTCPQCRTFVTSSCMASCMAAMAFSTIQRHEAWCPGA